MNISSREIRKNLRLLDQKYNLAMSSSSIHASLEAALYSKMALLELCGWIEEAIDTMLIDHIDRTVHSLDIRKTLKEEIIQRVYGFKYKDEFRPLMEKIVGAANFQKIITVLGKTRARDESLKNIFSELTKNRNRAAHTHWKTGVTSSFDAPSLTIQKLDTLLPIFRSIEQMVKRM